MKAARDHTGPANAEPPMPTASSALEAASSSMRLRPRSAVTSGICTTTTMSALSVSK
jgi:hypothetical protein